MAQTTAKILQHPATVRRAFESAGIHPALTSWIRAAVPPDVDILAGLRDLRARSREAAQNDDHMKFFLRLVEANVIGRQGIVVQAKPRLAGGGQDKSLSKRLESAWAAQCERGTWDVTGQHSRVGFERLGVRACAQDGEVLVRINEHDPESPTGFSVELLDAESLDIDYTTELSNGNHVRMGVEMTPRRRPVACWMFSEPAPSRGYGQSYTAAPRVRIPVSDIIHVMLPEWIWGTRGIPWASTALRRLKMLGGYEEAAITAARAAAVKSAVYVSQADANPDAGPAGDGTAPVSQDLTPGAIEQAPYGWDLKPLDWQWPNTDHGVFVREALRGISSGLGVAYNTLANDLSSVNYSSLRQGALSERDLWMMLQDWWIDWVTRPIYRRWVSYAVRFGLVSKANGMPLESLRISQYWQATFQGRRWPWVDPLKDLQAAQLAVQLRTKSISDVIRESGREPEEVWDELAGDLKTLERLGISPEAMSTAPAATPPTNGADANV